MHSHVHSPTRYAGISKSRFNPYYHWARIYRGLPYEVSRSPVRIVAWRVYDCIGIFPLVKHLHGSCQHGEQCRAFSISDTAFHIGTISASILVTCAFFGITFLLFSKHMGSVNSEKLGQANKIVNYRDKEAAEIRVTVNSACSNPAQQGWSNLNDPLSELMDHLRLAFGACCGQPI